MDSLFSLLWNPRSRWLEYAPTRRLPLAGRNISENDSLFDGPRRSSASGSRREGRAPGTSPASPQKSSPGALSYRVRQSSVACRTCRTIEQWAAGGMPVLPKRGAHGRPRLRSRHVSEIGAAKPTRPPSETPDTADTGHHFVGARGGAARGELLGFSARAKGAGSAPRRGVAGGPGPPRIPKGPTQKLPALRGRRRAHPRRPHQN